MNTKVPTASGTLSASSYRKHKKKHIPDLVGRKNSQKLTDINSGNQPAHKVRFKGFSVPGQEHHLLEDTKDCNLGHLAVMANDIELVEQLLADPKSKVLFQKVKGKKTKHLDDEDRSPIQLAAVMGRVDIFKAILEKYPKSAKKLFDIPDTIASREIIDFMLEHYQEGLYDSSESLNGKNPLSYYLLGCSRTKDVANFMMKFFNLPLEAVMEDGQPRIDKLGIFRQTLQNIAKGDFEMFYSASQMQELKSQFKKLEQIEKQGNPAPALASSTSSNYEKHRNAKRSLHIKLA